MFFILKLVSWEPTKLIITYETWVSVEWSLHRQKVRWWRSWRRRVRARPTLRGRTFFVCNDWSALMSNRWHLIVGHHFEHWVASGLSRCLQRLVNRVNCWPIALFWINNNQTFRLNNLAIICFQASPHPVRLSELRRGLLWLMLFLNLHIFRINLKFRLSAITNVIHIWD